MKKRIILITLLVVGFIGIYKSLGKVRPATGLRFSSILSLTGPAGYTGTQLKNGMDLANKNTKLDISFEDSKSSPADAVSAFQKLMSTQKPDMLIVMQSSIAGAITPLAISNKIPTLQTLVSASKIAAQSPYTFRYFTSGEQEIPIATDIMIKKLGVKKIAMIHIQDEYGLSYANALKSSVEPIGGVLVGTEVFDRTTTDFRAQIIKLKALNPDALYIIGQDGAIINILKQSKELRFETKFVTNWLLSDPTIRARAQGNEEGVYLTAPDYYLNPESQEIINFTNTYQAEYKESPSAYAAIGYDIVTMLSKIDKNAVQGPEDMIREFTNLKEMHGVMGTLSMDIDGEITFPLYPAVIRDGKLVELK